MQKEYLNYYNEKATIPVDLKKEFTRVQQNLNFFFNAIKNDHPESFNTIVQNLEERFPHRNTLLFEISKKLDLLGKYPALLEGIFDYLVTTMKYPYDNNGNLTLDEKAEVIVTDFLRAMLFHNYLIATSLTKILPREKALAYYKDILDRRIRNQNDPNAYVENLDELDKQGKPYFKSYQGHNGIIFRFNKGKRSIKFDKCKWHEIMKELNDPEFCYAVACHGDFETTKNSNQAFVMTRTRTLMQGDAFCDFCHDDTRIEEEIIHPPEEFWDNLK